MNSLLENIFWHTLSGPHAKFSSGTHSAKRYAVGFSPIVAFPDPHQPDFAALTPHCGKQERFYCDQWTGAAPADWRIDAESTMFRMLWNGSAPQGDDAAEAVPLSTHHAEQAVALAQLTNPGPFGPRTLELGDYFGYFDAGRLVAMAGERLHAGVYREISGVCTHPDYQGRGYARRLMTTLLRRQRRRGETSFLHVMRANESAHAMYARMGFRDFMETVVRVVAPI